MSHDTDAMRVLRAADATHRRVEPLFGDAVVVKRRVVEAMEIAERIVAEARETAAQVRELARREGRDEGLRDMMTLLDDARRIRNDAQDAAERDMVDLAFRLAERIIGRTLERNPDIVAEMIAARVEEQQAPNVRLLVAPDDLATVTAARTTIESRTGVRVTVEADDDLERGDCVIETGRGRADARIETQLHVLREALFEGAS